MRQLSCAILNYIFLEKSSQEKITDPSGTFLDAREIRFPILLIINLTASFGTIGKVMQGAWIPHHSRDKLRNLIDYHTSLIMTFLSSS